MNQPRRVTQGVLWLGAIVSPVFYVTVLVQALTRSGYSASRVPLSLLSLGSHGWVQIANFIGCGALSLVSSLGFRVALAGQRGQTWAPVLVATYGLGLITAGIWHPDPGLGFPPGAPSGLVTPISNHYILHWIGFGLVFTSLLSGSVLFSRLFRTTGEIGWSRYSLGSVLTGVAAVVTGLSTGNYLGVTGAGVILYSWMSVMAARLVFTTPVSQGTAPAAGEISVRGVEHSPHIPRRPTEPTSR